MNDNDVLASLPRLVESDAIIEYALKSSGDLFAIDDAGNITLKSGATLDIDTAAIHTITVLMTDGSNVIETTLTVEVTEAVAVTATESVAEPEPVALTEPESEPVALTEPVAVTEPEPEIEPVAVTKPEAVATPPVSKPAAKKIILAGDGDQTLNAPDDGAIIFGGRGGDIINLGDGADTIIYRFTSRDDGSWIANDGGDIINNFKLGKDKFVLADMDTTTATKDEILDPDYRPYNMDWGVFDTIQIFPIFDYDLSDTIIGVKLSFPAMDRGGGNAESASRMTINFHEDSYIRPYKDALNDDWATTAEGELFVGKDDAKFYLNEGILADRSLLANYFGGKDFFDVIGVDDLPFDHTPPAPKPDADNVLQGGDDDQTLNAPDDGAIIVGGRGDDIINLGDGADTVIQRFTSRDDGSWINNDGGDVINNFKLGEDKFVLADMDTTTATKDEILDPDYRPYNMDWGVFDTFRISPILDDSFEYLTGVVLKFPSVARGGGNDWLGMTINFHEDSYVRVFKDINGEDWSATTAEGELFVGKDGELLYFNGGILTDRTLLANYFGGEDFFDVIGVDDLSFDIL